MSAKTQELFNQAFELHRGRRFPEAAALYRQVIVQNPSNWQALHYLGMIEALTGNLTEAAGLMSRSVALQPENIDLIENYASVLCQAGDFATAAVVAEEALKLRQSPKLLHISGAALSKIGHHDRALARFATLLASQPRHVAALNGRAISLSELHRYDEALASIDAAIQAMPTFAEAYVNRGNICRRINHLQEAIVAFEKALQFKNDLVVAWVGLGDTLIDLGLFDKALRAFDRAIAINGRLAEAWFGRARAAIYFKDFEAAVAACDQAMALDPEMPWLEGLRIEAKLHACDWRNIEQEIEHLLGGVRAHRPVVSPFMLLSLPSTGEDQLTCAKTWSALKYPGHAPQWKGGTYSYDKIRIGYFSADFRTHPVSYLAAALFECHDQSRFETYAFSIGPGDKSILRSRLEKSFTRFVDLSHRSDQDIAAAIRSCNVDILVDLMGHTSETRLAVLAARPSPVQVNYLGYAGTVGGNHIDYIIADKTVIPPENRRFFSEKVVYLPDSFMPHDDEGRFISEHEFRRADFDLPEDAFVFCCFNNAYKINPGVIERWTNILRTVQPSVLWLSDLPQSTRGNLRHELESRGISAERLVFARRMDLPRDHLARLRLADLFLDTLPYNAHTTAGDALWAGLPVLTQIGETFAGRVGASLLNAIGLPELITHSGERYEALAIELASDRTRLLDIRERLGRNRLTTPLFDTARYTRHLESAFEAIYQRFRAELAPDHIAITPAT